MWRWLREGHHSFLYVVCTCRGRSGKIEREDKDMGVECLYDNYQLLIIASNRKRSDMSNKTRASSCNGKTQFSSLDKSDCLILNYKAFKCDVKIAR